MRLKKKLKNRSGFSLAETLLAVLILLLVSVIVANGIPAARNVYNNVIVGANAQVLLSTTVNALRNELGTARDVTVSGTDVTYYKSAIRAYSKLSLGSGTEGIQLLDYVNREDGTAIPAPGDTGTRSPHLLVTSAASNKDLYVTYEEPVIAGDVITFGRIEVRRKAGGSLITSLKELKIRMVPVSPTEA